MPVGLLNLGSKIQPVYNPAGATPGQVTIVNLDLTNPVYADYYNTVTGSSTLIGPLNSMTFDGTRTIYANAPAAAVQVLVVPGATGWTPSPIQQAEQIAASGVSLLSSPQLALQAAAAAVAVGTPVTEPASGYAAISQIGYDGVLQISALNTGTVLNVVHSWYEAGVQVATDSFWIYPAEVVTPHLLYFRGPTKGSQLRVTFTAYGNTVTIISYQIFQNSRVYESDIWRTVSGASFLGPGIVASATFDTASNVIASLEEATVAGGASVTLILPVWTGKARIALQSTSDVADASAAITAYSDQNITQGYAYYGFTDAQGVLDDDVELPRAQCTLILTNGNVNPKNLSVGITAAEY
jgi:hypothetical protein